MLITIEKAKNLGELNGGSVEKRVWTFIDSLIVQSYGKF